MNNASIEQERALIQCIQELIAKSLFGGNYEQGIMLPKFLELFPRSLSQRRITSHMGSRLTKEESISHIEISVALACFICDEPIGWRPRLGDAFISRSNYYLANDMLVVCPSKSLRWMLCNIDLGYLSISSARSELEHPMPHCNSIKLQVGLGERYKNIMGESWQRSW